MNSRTKELLAATDGFLKAHARWHKANHRPTVDDPWIDELEKMMEVFNHGDMPSECWDLQSAVGELSEAFGNDESEGRLDKPDSMTRTWTAIGLGFTESGSPIPERGLAKAREDMSPKEDRPIETIKELAAQGVNHEQIARMHGLVDKNGHGQYWLIGEELAKPGSIIGADGKPKPQYLPKQPDEPTEPAGKRLRKRFVSRKGQNEEPEQPCAESPRELWQQGLGQTEQGIKQAARMLQKPVDEVRELFEGFEGDMAGGQDEEKTAKVLELGAAGLDPKTIGKKLDMEPRAVSAILKRGKEQVAEAK